MRGARRCTRRYLSHSGQGFSDICGSPKMRRGRFFHFSPRSPPHEILLLSPPRTRAEATQSISCDGQNLVIRGHTHACAAALVHQICGRRPQRDGAKIHPGMLRVLRNRRVRVIKGWLWLGSSHSGCPHPGTSPGPPRLLIGLRGQCTFTKQGCPEPVRQPADRHSSNPGLVQCAAISPASSSAWWILLLQWGVWSFLRGRVSRKQESTGCRWRNTISSSVSTTSVGTAAGMQLSTRHTIRSTWLIASPPVGNIAKNLQRQSQVSGRGQVYHDRADAVS